MKMQFHHLRLHYGGDADQDIWNHLTVEGFLFALSPLCISKFLLQLSFMWEVNQAVLSSWSTDAVVNTPAPCS